MNHDIYLDANATSPVLPCAVAAAVEAMTSRYGNPSSSHAAGLRAKAILDDARARARRVIGARQGALLFTSGATEGIHTAVLSALCAIRERQAAGEPCGDLLLYGATEHKAVPESLAHWNRLLGAGLRLQPLPVDANGRHRLDLLRELAPRAAMVCTMAANNETGAVSDLDGIAQVLRDCAPAAYWMVDCVQALGKLPLDVCGTPTGARIDYAPFSGHKLYAPKGIGMLYVREGAPYTPLITGGGQECGLRSGTENMAGIAALGAVLRALEEGTTFRSHADMAAMRARLAEALREAFPDVMFNVPFEHTLPTTLNFAVPGLASRELLDLFDAAGVRVSAGSACSAAKAAPSYVLEAMGLPLWQSSGAVRLSFGPLADDALIDAACARIRRCGQAVQCSPLAPSSLAPDQVGIAQFSCEGRHGWLLFDHANKACVAIDPPPALAPRIADAVRGHGLRLLAALGTGVDPEGAAARAALRTALGLDASDPGPLGWPQAGATALVLGARRLRRSGEGTAQACYALDARDVAHGRAIVFAGGLGAGPAGTDPRAILCHGIDVDGVACGRAGAASTDAIPELEADRLASFLDTHGDALLVDVREAGEAAAGPLTLHGRATYHLPLSRLVEHIDQLLAASGRPLVFVCRSGRRSARAAQCLQRFGHPRVLSVAGGIALAG